MAVLGLSNDKKATKKSDKKESTQADEAKALL